MLSVRPGTVNSAANLMEKSFGTVISSEDCARGSLNKITSKAVYGGDFHEIHGVFIENILLDLVPITF